MNYELLLGIDDDDAALRSPLYECIMSNQSQPCISLVEVTCYFALEMEQTNRSAISQKYQTSINMQPNCLPWSQPLPSSFRAFSEQFPGSFRATVSEQLQSNWSEFQYRFFSAKFLIISSANGCSISRQRCSEQFQSSFRAVSEQFQSNASTAPR